VPKADILRRSKALELLSENMGPRPYRCRRTADTFSSILAGPMDFKSAGGTFCTGGCEVYVQKNPGRKEGSPCSIGGVLLDCDGDN
jgi:hypothetical protein